jgi:hypothetical protein
MASSDPNLRATPSTSSDAKGDSTKPATGGHGPVDQSDHATAQRQLSSQSRQRSQQARESGDKAAAARAAAREVVAQAMEAAAKIPQPEVTFPDVIVEGSGGKFTLRARAGVLFGAHGLVTVAGQQCQVDGWGATKIEGRGAPAGGGEVVVHVDDQVKFYGFMK